MKRKLTAKQKVQRRYPAAYAKYVGLSLQFVIVRDGHGPELGGYRLRERDAWASAATALAALDAPPH